MGGYVFAIGRDNPKDTIRTQVNNGVYSTYINKATNNGPRPFEGTIADYSSMKPGDNIYFFSNRKFYGIGKLVNVGYDCKYCNYPNSTALVNKEYKQIKDNLLVDYGTQSPHYRWICTFVPQPKFFCNGVDIDDLLTYKPSTFKMIRAFWKLSFIKIGDEENESLKEFIMLRNQDILSNSNNGVFSYNDDLHKQLNSKNLSPHRLSIKPLLESCCYSDKIKHEMAIEAAISALLTDNKDTIFGHWDYISHQVIASPFKPIDYMDKIDVFAYRYIKDTCIISRYLVMEIKKDTADESTITQIMKYVDWVCKEYTYGDYSRIEAYVLAYDFSQDAFEALKKACNRSYTQGSHPATSRDWKDIRLVKYEYRSGELIFKDETP